MSNKTVIISLKVSPEERQQILESAKEERITMSEFIRRAIEEYLYKK